MSKYSWQNKLAVITGGASGMGKVMAIRLLGYGAKVVVLDNNADRLQQLAGQYPSIHTRTCDVSDGTAVQNTAADIEQNLGPVHFLLHGAAIMPGGALEETSPEELQQVMRINFFGTVEITSAFLPYMRQRNAGSCVVFGSIVGEIPIIRFGAYGASKAATNYYMKVLMDEYRHTGIQLLLVCPPAVNTPLIGQAVDKGPGQLREMQDGQRKMMTPEKVLDAIEKALRRKQKIIFPGEAGIMHLAYRLLPALVRYVMLKTN